MAEKHLYEFEEGGYYAAESQEAAFAQYDADCGESIRTSEVNDDAFPNTPSEYRDLSFVFGGASRVTHCL